MFCNKCGTENAEGNAFCSSCGAPLSGGETPGQGTSKGEALTQMAKSLPSGMLTIVAACFIFLGTLLPWASASLGYGGSYSNSGIQMAQGAALLLVAVLCIAVLLLQRSGAAGAWDQVSALLSILAVILVFQALYHITNSDFSVGAGYWLSMIGVLILAVSNALQFFGSSES